MTEQLPDLAGNIEEPIHASTAGNKRGIMALSLSSFQAREWFQKQRESIQPWAEFVNTSKFGIPKSITPVGSRLTKNLSKFQSNYMFVFLALCAFCILTSPLLLVALAVSLGACYVISIKNKDQKYKIFGHELSLGQQYGVVGLMSFPLLWIAGAGSVVFWVIGASFFAIALHALLYRNEDDVAEQFEQLQMEQV